jgi:hypothetical protein
LGLAINERGTMEIEILISEKIIKKILKGNNLNRETIEHLEYLKKEIQKNEKIRFTGYRKSLDFLR